MKEYLWVFEILFGGLGTAIISYIFFKKINRNTLNQKQKAGKNSINIQAGRNIEVKNIENSSGKK